MATSSSIHSNAFNFLSFVESGVDPRTGQYTCSLSLPELNGNDLAGPQLPLRLAYNPLNTLDSGFGKGWSLQLSQYDTGTNIITLSSGESFLVTGTSSDGNELFMQEKKLDTFHLHDLGGNRFQVVHKTGLVEELAVIGADGLAVPVLLQSPSGHHLSLDYDLFTRHALLKSVANADGSLLLGLARSNARVEVRLHPGSSAESLFSLMFSGSENRVSRIELPTDNRAGWRFDYEVQEGLLCINRVEGPLGGSEQIFYNGGTHAFPGADNRRLPRVARHLHDPGAGQPLVDTRYEYSANNFLGRNAPGLSWQDNGLDNLYKVLSDYTYFSIEKLWDTDSEKARRTITRTFNRFHLSTEERTEQGDCVQRVETEYHLLAGEAFEDQPEKCQLPKTVTHAWHRTSESGKERKDVRHTDYDRHGNEILRIEANGVSEASEYYPLGGSDGCPADPQGFVRHLKEKVVTPAPSEYGDAPVLRHAYRYASHPPVSGASTPWVALVEETLFQVSGNVELQKLRTHYAIQPANGFLHGRKAKSEVFLGGKGTFSDFFYTRPQGRRAAEPVLRTTEILSTSFDATTKTIIRESSLINGEPLLDLDDNDVEVAYVYDPLGRVIEETVAPGSDYQATRSYEYILVAETGGSASQTVNDVKQVRTRSHVDGLQRLVREERQDPGKTFREIYLARHDAFGHQVESTEIDWLDDEDRPLVSQYGYDDWDLQASLTDVDGVTRHTLNDPVAREVQTWRDGEGRTITRSNPFDKPDSVERLDLEGESYSQHLYFYDGLGRTHHDLDEMQNFRYYQYDAFDRMTLSGLPDGTEVERRYAGHSRKELPTWIGVDGKVIGEQDFDGLGRRLWLEVGSARDEYHYEGSQSRPGEHLTPAGESIAFTYAPQLTTEPVSLMAEDEASYTYDALDARLRVAQNSRGRREFDYDAANHPSVERWCDGDTTWTARYSHSRLGRQWLHEDINGLETRSDYDLAGRLEHVKQGQIEVDYSYDSLSRPYLTRCHDLDSGSELVTTLAFDDWGREVSRTLALSGQPTRSITQAYRPDDRLSSRHQQSAGQTLLLETFAYDERGRLTHHVCSGTQLPMDRFGNAITEQSFDFDALDNLREVYTRFADGSEDTCTRSFATNDPCQLVKLVHTHADYPASLDLDYDANGNLLVDEQGRALAYDRQNRLLQVKNPNGQVLVDYHYDAHNQLCGEDRGSAAHVLRFYQDDRLDCTVQGTTRISYLHTQGRPLAQQQVDSPDGTLLLLTGASNSVLGEGQQQTLRETRYSAFGERSDASLQCPLGFNGEVRDQQTGWYLLGKGYRAYNPYLMCFHSRDFLSPFEAGGINGYMYCAGDPVNFRDPTGHFFDFLPSWMTPVMKWGGLALGAIGVAISLGALVTPGIGLMAAFMKASTLTQISTVASVVSAGTGVGSVMAKDEQTSNVLGTVSFVTGLVGVAVGLKALPNALKKKALNTTTVADDLPQATTPNPVVNNLDDAASSLSAPQSSGNVTTSSSPPAAPSPPQAPSVTQNATQLHMQDSQAISASRQSGAPPENTLSKVRNPASGRRNSI